MKPYNIKQFVKTGPSISIWVDLDHILEIIEPKDLTLSYQYMFKDSVNSITFSHDHVKNINEHIALRKITVKEVYEYIYLPFLEAWKNKDIINVSK